MELRHFRYFAAVAQYLNYSEASRRLHVAQPAISQTILDLEEEICAKLFLRSHRKVQLTAAGTTLFLFDEAVAMCRRAGFSPKVRHEPDLMTTVFVLVECGLGVSLVPGCARGFEQQKTIRRPLTVPSAPMCLCAIWPRGSESPTVNAFLNILRERKPAIQKFVTRLCQGWPPLESARRKVGPNLR
jgi:DNA-binding transcriptional LysR family regulator